MTEKELNRLYWLGKEIKSLERQLKSLDGYGELNYSGDAVRSGTSNPTETIVMKRLKLSMRLNEKYIEFIEEHHRISDYILGVEDVEVQTIMQLRFIEQKNWYDIAAALSPDDRDIARTTFSRKLKKYLEDK